MKILLVEDEHRLATLVKQGLEEEAFLVDVLDRGTDVLPALKRQPYDALILDIQLPGLDGIEVCRQLRKAGHGVPVLMLTARATIPDRVKGLQGGADDYLTKPFAFEELVARLRALLRRGTVMALPQVRAGDLVVDTSTKQVFCPGGAVDLTAKEYLLLELLVRHPGQIFSREQIIGRAWDSDFDGDNRVVEVFIHGLRRKLHQIGSTRCGIKTVRGLGYKLEVSR